MSKTIMIHNMSLETSQAMEKEYLTYSFAEVIDRFYDLNLEEAQLMQSIIYKEMYYFLLLYTNEALQRLFLEMDNIITAMENGIELKTEKLVIVDVIKL